MHIDKFKQSDGHFLDENGCYYEDAEEFFSTITGFCMCGCPDLALEYVLGGLKLLNIRFDDTISFEQWDEKCKDYFGNEKAQYFFWYWLDNKELSEHGSSVPGWLTQEGVELMEDLEEFFKEKEDEIE